jgi:phosphoserine phosphatase RsbU/P
VPLGLFCSSPYQSRRITMDPLDSLLLYTDGLTEARNGRDEEYGTERLVNVASGSRRLPPEALVSACLADLATFQSGVAKVDDMAAMVIRRSAL